MELCRLLWRRISMSGGGGELETPGSGSWICAHKNSGALTANVSPLGTKPLSESQGNSAELPVWGTGPREAAPVPAPAYPVGGDSICDR